MDLSSVFNHKDLSPVSHGEVVLLDSDEGTFTFHKEMSLMKRLLQVLALTKMSSR